MRHQEKPESRRRQDEKEKQTSVHSVAIILKTQAAPSFLLQTSASSEATSPASQVSWSTARAKARKPTQVCEPGTPQKTQAHTPLNCQFSLRTTGQRLLDHKAPACIACLVTPDLPIHTPRQAEDAGPRGCSHSEHFLSKKFTHGTSLVSGG